MEGWIIGDYKRRADEERVMVKWKRPEDKNEE